MRRSIFPFFLIALMMSCTNKIEQVKHEFVQLPAGMFVFGSNENQENESPAVPCRVEAFELSISEVSNEQFEVFVKETGYVTDAEKSGGMVFNGKWKLDETANWKMPEGKQVDRKTWLSLPVVQVSYSDALAYCTWADCRLPSEIEWEYASKKGKSSSGKMNITTSATSYPKTEKVESFGKNELGIYHQSGNVWEWCVDSYNSEIHDKLSLIRTTEAFAAFQGRSFDFEKMYISDTLRVIKGGSFLCQKGHCAGYRPEARQSAEQHQGYYHIGFRVAKNIEE